MGHGLITLILMVVHGICLSLLFENKFGSDWHILKLVGARTSVVEKVVCRLSFGATFDLVEGVVANVLHLESFRAVSENFGILLGETSFKRGALFAHNLLFDQIWQGLFGLHRVEALSHLVVIVLESVQKVAIVDISRLHCCSVQIVVIHNCG